MRSFWRRRRCATSSTSPRLAGGQLFAALLSAAAGLVLASVVWRLPAIERLEDEEPGDEPVSEARGASQGLWAGAVARRDRPALMPPAAILDIDGTLVDTNYQHALAWYRAFRQHGVVLPIWRIHRAIGMGGDQLVAALAGDEVEGEHG